MHGFRKRLAGYSGAVLGYIGGNIPGAYIGYKTARKLYQFKRKMMTPQKTPSKRKASTPRKYGKTGKKRKVYKRSFRKYKKRSVRRAYKKAKRMANYGQRIVGPNGIYQHNDAVELDGGVMDMRKSYKQVKTTATFKFEEGKTGIVAGLDGTQQVSFFQPLATRAQLFGITASGRTNFLEQWDVDPFILNPFVSRPTSSLYPAPISQVTDTDKLYVQSCKHSLNLYNMSTTPCEVEIYYFTPRVDCTIRPDVAWVNALAAERLNQNAPVTDNTLGANTAQSGTGIAIKVGSLPTTLKAFRKQYRVVKHHKLIFQGGDRQTINSTVRFNRVFTRKILEQRSSGYYAGITLFPLIIVKGALVGVAPATGSGSSETISGPATEVTYGETKLGWVTENTWIFGGLPVNRFDTTRVFIPTLTDADAVAAQTLAQVDVEDDIEMDKKV